MKRIILLTLAAFAATSCGFVRINGDKLSDVIREGLENGDINVVFNGDTLASRAKIVASDNYITKDYPVDLFSSIRTDIPCDVTYTDGQPFLSISAPDNVLEYVSVENRNGELVLSLPRASLKFKKMKGIRVTVSSPMLNGLTINGAGDFDAPSGIVTDSFNAVVSGAADMDIDGLKCDGIARIVVNGAGDIDLEKVECGSLKVEISGAGDCTVEGHAGDADFTVNGAGDVDIHDFSADNLQTRINGVGNVRRN